MKKVLMFAANWCGPCRQVKPAFESLKQSMKNVEFQIVDVDENPIMSTNYGVNSVPTFLIVENDKEVDRFIGGHNFRMLKESLEGKNNGKLV